ncbi:hypothetical protein HK098_008257 [Nowakowskiella sp. JEL0407]|nr:hypothetical protein HK098_008257 [Nowakowskiella sp. JEL0407]
MSSWTFIGELFDRLRNAQFLTKLTLAIRETDLRDLDIFLRSSSVKSLVLYVRISDHSIWKYTTTELLEIYRVLITTSQSMKILLFYHPNFEPPRFGIQTHLRFNFSNCNTAAINNSRSQLDHFSVLQNHAEFVRIGPQTWKLVVHYQVVLERNNNRLFEEVYECWKKGDGKVSSSHETNMFESLKLRYQNVEMGLICGKWSIWYEGLLNEIFEVNELKSTTQNLMQAELSDMDGNKIDDVIVKITKSCGFGVHQFAALESFAPKLYYSSWHGIPGFGFAVMEYLQGPKLSQLGRKSVDSECLVELKLDIQRLHQKGLFLET